MPYAATRDARGAETLPYRPPRYLRKEAVASAARVCAGSMGDVVALIIQPRMSMAKRLMEKMGSPVSLVKASAANEQRSSNCPACDVEISRHWLVAFNKDKQGVVDLFDRVGRRLMSEEAATAGDDLSEIVHAERRKRKGLGVKVIEQKKTGFGYEKVYSPRPTRSKYWDGRVEGSTECKDAQPQTSEETRRKETQHASR